VYKKTTLGIKTKLNARLERPVVSIMYPRALLILNRLKTKIYEKLKGGRRRPL